MGVKTGVSCDGGGGVVLSVRLTFAFRKLLLQLCATVRHFDEIVVD